MEKTVLSRHGSLRETGLDTAAYSTNVLAKYCLPIYCLAATGSQTLAG